MNNESNSCGVGQPVTRDRQMVAAARAECTERMLIDGESHLRMCCEPMPGTITLIGRISGHPIVTTRS